MDMTTTLFLLCVLCTSLNNISPANSQMVPALYVFGDSTVDGGNFRIYDPAYGIDQNTALPKRFSNGKTIADFIANFLGLPIVPPYNHTSQAGTYTTGVNYGFSGCGILPETGPESCLNSWSLVKQMEKFNSTLVNLTKVLNQRQDIVSHVKESIFFFSIGINDYALNYLPPASKFSKLAPEAFAQLLLNRLSSHITTLYGYGARKFLVNNIWPLGCTPRFANVSDPLAFFCNETINKLVRPYSQFLPLMLKELKFTLPGSVFSNSDNFWFLLDLKANPLKYSITNTIGKCLSADFGGTPCKERVRYLYYDVIHTTEAANRIFSLNCYGGVLCAPLNIMYLAGANVY